MSAPRDCDACGLCGERLNVVCPDGDPLSPIALLGEAPGKVEDETGRPFQGRSGKVLDALLEEGGLPRESIFITNTVKCRPPGNRVPTKGEMEACRPYLEDELQDRRLIVALGRTAAKSLLGREVRLSEELNKVMKVMIRDREIDLIATYHPAASFYNSGVKDALRETIRVAKTYLDYDRTVSSTGR